MVDFGFASPRKKEKAIFDGILLHLATVTEAVDAFRGSVTAIANGDPSSARLVDSVFDAETRADGIHRELSTKIAEGAFFGGVREDILNLLERIDDIADAAKDAARYLGSDSQLVGQAPDLLKLEQMKLFVADLGSAVAALTELVKALKVGKKEALSKVHSVESFEEEADTHKAAILKVLFANERSMDPVTVIQLRDFIFVADNIADRAEDASDVILILIAKGYG